jgi:hypothetical protein
MNLLRATVREVLQEARVITLRAQNRNDLSMALQWVQSNKKLRSAGDIELLDDKTYIVKIRAKGRPDDAINLINDRFGSFVKVV